MRIHSAFLAVVVAVLPAGAVFSQVQSRPAASGAATAPALLSAAEVQKLMDGGQWREALRALTRIVGLKGPAAAAYERHRMLMQQAECQMQIREDAAALTTLRLAHTEAYQGNRTDDQCESCVLLFLIAKSNGYKYTSKRGGTPPIDILKKENRSMAYSALLADELPAMTEQGQKAKAFVSLTPLLDVANRFEGVRSVDQIVNGNSKKTDGIGKDLTATATRMIRVSLDDANATIKRIEELANRQVRDPRGVMGIHRAGLLPADGDILQSIIIMCGKVPAAIADLNHAFKEPLPVAQLSTKADNVAFYAKRVAGAG